MHPWQLSWAIASAHIDHGVLEAIRALTQIFDPYDPASYIHGQSIIQDAKETASLSMPNMRKFEANGDALQFLILFHIAMQSALRCTIGWPKRLVTWWQHAGAREMAVAEGNGKQINK